MNKTTKGALGASAAAVLLLGGAGSLAYWTSEASVNGGSITAGTLGISPLNIGSTTSPCDASWTHAGTVKTGQVVNLFVPGDKVTKKCTFKIAATGDNLSATVAAPASLTTTGTPAGTSLKIDTAATYTVSKAAASRTIANGGLITSADNEATLTATFVATIPFGTDESGAPKVNANDTKSIVTALQDLKVSVTQANPNA